MQKDQSQRERERVGSVSTIAINWGPSLILMHEHYMECHSLNWLGKGGCKMYLVFSFYFECHPGSDIQRKIALRIMQNCVCEPPAPPIVSAIHNQKKERMRT